MKKTLFAIALTVLAATATAPAQLIFTQYYEGSSGTNKFTELKNLGDTALDLTAFTVSLYTNAAAENWKAGTASTTNFALSGSLAAGGVLVLGNSIGSGGSTYIPSYLTGASFTAANSVMNFNGNDSVVLWNDTSAFGTSQILDALSFTNAGNEGADKSYVRTTANTGYNLTVGSTMNDFPSVWTLTTLADVNTATAGTDNYLGSSSVTAVPEPGTVALVTLGLGAVLLGVRRRRA